MNVLELAGACVLAPLSVALWLTFACYLAEPHPPLDVLDLQAVATMAGITGLAIYCVVRCVANQ